MIHVVSGVAFNDGHVLMGKRKATGLRPALWELPGGKLENGESAKTALAREWLEELGVVVEVNETLIGRVSLDLETELTVDLHEVAMRGAPKCIDHDEIAWVRPLYAVKNLPCSPGWYLHYPMLRALMQSRKIWSEP